ncbi:unnamed protein product [Timema podura]|uniref:Uncharacterized protein n=1 Tax=Timema podura TaxID=61482 RepID=A0ABN7PNE6_TIMPD|nr:unnamed protein product [Timema podura]
MNIVFKGARVGFTNWSGGIGVPSGGDSDKEMIWRVWIMRKLSLERTKQTVDMYYSVRNLIPEFFRNRDPFILQEQQVFERVQTIPTPVLLEDYTQLLITRIFNTEEGNFDMNQFVKVLMMVSDLLLRSSCSLGIHLVMDFKNVTMGVIRQVTPSVLKKLQVVITVSRLSMASRNTSRETGSI